ncbi:hypothetical protein [Endozoicomonas elysicola]|uniref:hypothetical protein n=1 Tax=Endozoicomonas elysicola TaxID=305900 RepID=UPI000363780C|nr:hypothetical protein [Endozoicomonas elysicola]
MSDALVLVRQLHQEIHAVEHRIRHHPYFKALEARKFELVDLQYFIGEQRYIISSDLRGLALLISRCEQLQSQVFFQDILKSEFVALEALEVLASAVGMAKAERETYEPEPGAQAYSAYMAWLCQYGSDAEVAAALSINLATWGANCARMARALQNLYGFKEPDLLFFSRFAESPVEVGSAALAIIDAGLKKGIAPRRIRRAVRMLQGYELLFWDAVYKLSVGGGEPDC